MCTCHPPLTAAEHVEALVKLGATGQHSVHSIGLLRDRDGHRHIEKFDTGRFVLVFPTEVSP